MLRNGYLPLLSFLPLAFGAWGPPMPAQTLPLATLPWTLTSTNRSISIPTKFPYQAHLALLDAGIIDEPNVGLNEGLVRWVGEEDVWTWTAKLGLEGVLGADEYFLVFEGLAVFCNVSIDSHHIGYSDNAFRTWIWNATDAIKSASESSAITLKFGSSFKVANALARDQKNEQFPIRNAPSMGMSTTSDRYEYDSRNWARTAQSDFGWDWGPAYLPSGPNKPAYLIGLSTAAADHHLSTRKDLWAPDVQPTQLAINPKPERGHWKKKDRSSKRDVEASSGNGTSGFWLQRTFVDVYKKGQTNNYAPNMNAPWIVNVTVPVVTPLSPSHFKGATLSFSVSNTSISIPKQDLRIIYPVRYTKGISFSLSTLIEIPKDAVEMWWPAALGTPKLYNLELSVETAGETVEWTERIGFRTMRVNQEPFTKAEVASGITPGTRFQFEINGHPFYVQGSSLIPIDVFDSRVKANTTRWLLESTVLAHQNVIRIWGGGIYQTDEFYDLCDEIGVIAWSEAIYACGAYPVTPDFVENAQAELADNVQRLNKHPSVGLWATNNEGEGYLTNVNHTRPNGSIYFDQYNYYNNYVLRDVILRNTKSLSFLPSSTTNGYTYMDDDHYISRYSNGTEGEIYGDKELYNFNVTFSFNLSSYPVARFVNEFGFHSMPSIYTWDEVLDTPQAYAFNSSAIRAHNKHTPAGNLTYPWPADDGQAQLTEAVEMYFPRPVARQGAGGLRTELAAWAYSTQIFQAQYITNEIAYYRLGASRGEHNMGALYWQLNDIWQGSTWASIEYSGRWKPFHYFAERMQDHVIISPFYNATNGTLDVYATSDLWNPVKGQAKLTWYNFAGDLLSSITTPFSISALNSTLLASHVSPRRFVPSSTAINDAWLHLEIQASDGKGGQWVNEGSLPLFL